MLSFRVESKSPISLDRLATVCIRFHWCSR